MNLTEQYPSRLVRHLLGFPRSLLYRTPADLRAALLRLIADEKVYHKSTRRPAKSPLRGFWGLAKDPGGSQRAVCSERFQ
jgi:hypothetical protein